MKQGLTRSVIRVPVLVCRGKLCWGVAISRLTNSSNHEENIKSNYLSIIKVYVNCSDLYVFYFPIFFISINVSQLQNVGNHFVYCPYVSLLFSIFQCLYCIAAAHSLSCTSRPTFWAHHLTTPNSLHYLNSMECFSKLFSPRGPFLSHARPKPMRARCLSGFSVMWVTKLLISPVKIRIFAQKSPSLARKWHFCSFWARPCRLIWLVVVARGLYLARHLFTLFYYPRGYRIITANSNMLT